jgi:uncharacterized NAD(P)/FAD-binding protein YdhS
MKTVSIIGGGFSGCLTTIHLLQKSDNVYVKLINCNYPIIQGVAYSTKDHLHLLNVPAGRMSAFADKPDHFINWLRTKREFKDLIDDKIELQFFPRAIYGIYLTEIISDYTSQKQLEFINAEAINITQKGSKYFVQLNNNNSIESDAVVLAMGNYLPAEPKVENKFDFDDINYFKNPWDNSFLKDIDINKDILLVGTGLTMIDCVCSLLKLNFKGKIIAVSPRGYIPAKHTNSNLKYPDFFPEFQNKTLIEIFNITRTHLRIAELKNIPWQAVIEVIRPHTKEIWLQLSLKDRKQFISHLRHIWGVARHRLPESIHNKIMNAIKSGQMQVLGGRLKTIEKENSFLNVTLKLRKENISASLKVGRIVNCTGPQGNLSEIKNELIANLLGNRLISPDELKLGINALPDGRILNSDNQISKNIFAVGSLLRGILWETTAVPELSINAEIVADQIINTI